MNSTCPSLSPDRLRKEIQEAVDRRETFLRNCWENLGQTQREHLTGHCLMVSRMAYNLCLAMHLPESTAQRVRLAGLFHDIGKCAVPESLLAKSGPLSPSQRRIVDQHAALGARYTLAITGDSELAGIVGGHHRGCLCSHSSNNAPKTSLLRHQPSQANLCLQASIVQAADAMVSMTSDRPYASARTVSAALAELRRCGGSQFDPHVVRAAHEQSVWIVAA